MTLQIPQIDGKSDVLQALQRGQGMSLPPGVPTPQDREAQNPLMSGSLEDRLEGKEGYQLAAEVEGIKSEWLRARMGREEGWFRDLSFYGGDQWCAWNAARQVLTQRTRAPNWMIRRTINLTKPTVQHAVAILTKGDPKMRVVVGHHSERSAFGVKSANAAAQYLWRRMGYGKARRAAARLKSITGTVGHEIEWDMLGGAYRPMGEAELGMSGVGMGQKEGTARRNLLTVFNLLPDPKATGDDDGEGLMVLREVDCGRLRALYPQAAEYLRPEPIGASNLGIHYLQQFQAMTSQFGWRTDTTASRNSLLVKTLYLPRSLRYPFGRVIVVANHTLLYDGNNPVYSEDLGMDEPPYRWPVFIYRHDWDGVSFWGRGFVSDIVDPQRTLNQLYSKALAIVFSMANPKWIVQSQVGGKQLKITDEPGQVIRIPPTLTADQAVKVVYGADLPSTIPQLINSTQEFMEQIAGIREATAGGIPSARASGRQLDIMRGQDASRLEQVRLDDVDTMEKELSYLLELVRRYWTTPRMVKVVGANLRTSVESFRGMDIPGGAQVEIEEDFELSMSAEARSMIVNAAVNNGLLNPQDPADKARALELMGMRGSMRTFEAETNADRERAHRENELLARGQAIDEMGLPTAQVKPWDEHRVHVDAHTVFMRSQEFEELPPERQQAFEVHLYEHIMRLETQMAGQAGQTGMIQEAMAATGQPGMMPPDQAAAAEAGGPAEPQEMP